MNCEENRVPNGYYAFQNANPQDKLRLCLCLDLETTRLAFRDVLSNMLDMSERQKIREELLKEYNVPVGEFEDKVWEKFRENHENDWEWE